MKNMEEKEDGERADVADSKNGGPEMVVFHPRPVGEVHHSWLIEFKKNIQLLLVDSPWLAKSSFFLVRSLILDLWHSNLGFRFSESI